MNIFTALFIHQLLLSILPFQRHQKDKASRSMIKYWIWVGDQAPLKNNHKQSLTHNSKNGPVTNALQVKPCSSFVFRYSTVSLFPAKNCGRIATAFSFLVSLPNSDGTKRLTPALTAASMIRLCSPVLTVAMVEMTTSWPVKARRSSDSG